MNPLVVRKHELPPEGQTYPVELGEDDLNRALCTAGFDATHCLRPVEAEARVFVSGADIFVIGTLQTHVRYQCVRCLTSFEETVEANFHLTFAEDPDRGGDVELHREDLEVEAFHGETLDLTEIVLEQLYLALRPHPVCKDACQGLCPECGADRNALDCGCVRRSSDPRFAVLEKWAQRDQNPVQGTNRQR